MSTFETALKFWWGPHKWWGPDAARGACLICLIVNPPIIIIIIIISLFAHSETMIVSIEHSKTHSMYKYNNYIQQLYITI